MDERYVVVIGGNTNTFPNRNVEVITLVANGTRLGSKATAMPSLCQPRTGHAVACIRGRILVCGGAPNVRHMEVFISENDRFQRGCRAFKGWSPKGQWTILVPEPITICQRVFFVQYRGDLCIIQGELAISI